MALQWLILTYVVAAEASIAIILTLPWPKLIRYQVASFISLILQPATGIIPFAAFQLMDLYWKNEHRLMCTSEVCTSDERDHYEKSALRALSRGVDDAGGIYWNWQFDCTQGEITMYARSIHRICKYHKDIKELEEVEKRCKNM